MLSSSMPESRALTHPDDASELLSGPADNDAAVWHRMQTRFSPSTTKPFNSDYMAPAHEDLSTSIASSTLANLMQPSQGQHLPLVGASHVLQSLAASSHFLNHYHHLWAQLTLAGMNGPAPPLDRPHLDTSVAAALTFLHDQLAKSTTAPSRADPQVSVPFPWNPLPSSSPQSSCDVSFSSSLPRASPSVPCSSKGEPPTQCASTSPGFQFPHQPAYPHQTQPHRKSSLSHQPAMRDNSVGPSEPIAVPYANKRVNEESEVYWRQRKVLVIQTQDVEEHFRNSLLKNCPNKRVPDMLAASNPSFPQHILDPVEQHFLCSLKEDFSQFHLTAPNVVSLPESVSKRTIHLRSPTCAQAAHEESPTNSHCSYSSSHVDNLSLSSSLDKSSDSCYSAACKGESVQPHKPKHKWSMRYQQDTLFQSD